MSNPSQYGQTLFLSDLQVDSSTKKLSRIHFRKNGPEPAPYDEAWIQRLIMQEPGVLPVDQIEPAFADLVPVCTELPMRSGFLDSLLVTPAGDLALIECKLWRNPEARREVVGQILDYAKEMCTWSYETLQGAINRTQPLKPSDEKTRSLYQLISAGGAVDEASFHDAVSRNLRRGRFLLLIVGDGIREEAESLVEFLQQSAGLHFTLALVELALLEGPAGGYIVQPRVLAKTTNIDRGIVLLDEGRLTIKPVALTDAGKPARPTTITQERFLEQLENGFPGASEKLHAFVEELAACIVSPEFGTDSMILRWRPDGGKSWNLGTITSSGALWMDYLGQQAKNGGLIHLSKQYVTRLAEIVPGAVVTRDFKETAWNVYRNGKNITIDVMLADQSRRRAWLLAIEEFQAAVLKTSDE